MPTAVLTLLQTDFSPGSLPVQILKGIYLGLLTGLLPAMIALAMGFLFKYVTRISIPAFGVVVLAVALAGMNGGLLAIVDPKVQDSANATTLVTALLVVMMLALYGHGKGDAAATAFPRRLSLQSFRSSRLPSDVIEFVGGRGEVSITVVAVEDAEGYPPLPEDLRAEIAAETVRLPAGLSVGELESQVADELRTTFDLADVTVAIDQAGEATVTAAPPVSGVSRRVPSGKRATSVSTLLPTGLARGDDVQVHADDAVVSGTVVSAGAVDSEDGSDDETATEAGRTTTADGTTTGGPGRLTLAASRAETRALLEADEARTVVTARGTEREYELIALLRRAGQQIRRLAVAADGPLDGQAVGEIESVLAAESSGGSDGESVNLEADRPSGDADAGTDATTIEIGRGTAGESERGRIAVLARRTAGSWRFDPDLDRRLDGGDELFVVGDRATVTRLAEVAT